MGVGTAGAVGAGNAINNFLSTLLKQQREDELLAGDRKFKSKERRLDRESRIDDAREGRAFTSEENKKSRAASKKVAEDDLSIRREIFNANKKLAARKQFIDETVINTEIIAKTRKVLLEKERYDKKTVLEAERYLDKLKYKNRLLDLDEYKTNTAEEQADTLELQRKQQAKESDKRIAKMDFDITTKKEELKKKERKKDAYIIIETMLKDEEARLPSALLRNNPALIRSKEAIRGLITKERKNLIDTGKLSADFNDKINFLRATSMTNDKGTEIDNENGSAEWYEYLSTLSPEKDSSGKSRRDKAVDNAKKINRKKSIEFEKIKDRPSFYERTRGFREGVDKTLSKSSTDANTYINNLFRDTINPSLDSSFSRLGGTVGDVSSMLMNLFAKEVEPPVNRSLDRLKETGGNVFDATSEFVGSAYDTGKAVIGDYKDILNMLLKDDRAGKYRRLRPANERGGR